jgi:hypothetical protein
MLLLLQVGAILDYAAEDDTGPGDTTQASTAAAAAAAAPAQQAAVPAPSPPPRLPRTGELPARVA